MASYPIIAPLQPYTLACVPTLGILQELGLELAMQIYNVLFFFCNRFQVLILFKYLALKGRHIYFYIASDFKTTINRYKGNSCAKTSTLPLYYIIKLLPAIRK